MLAEGAPWWARLRALGLDLPPVPAPVAAYVPALCCGSLILVSGQLPLVAGQLAHRGRVGQDLGVEEGQAAARLCALNALAAACGVVPQDCALAGVARVEGFVQCGPEFHDQARVCNGASELFGALFPGAGHARLAIGCSALPLDAAVEIAVTFLLAGRL